MLFLKLIENLSFFADFSTEEKQKLLETDSYFATYQDGEYLIREGDEDRSLFILMDGQVQVTMNDRPNAPLATLQRESVFGEIAFLTRGKRSANVIAHGVAKVFKLDGDLFQRLPPEMQTKIQSRLIHLLVNRLEKHNHQLTGHNHIALTPE
ncbi:MAG: cyclic nucleotide-binding domain-containing protein [Magnetococcales bacterium]|nr:cyclic nucleotide-binding domain-containing protein [Magnetococcales bacterium]NGZ28459.1 cyclic nucleotide-binding domain-containing protein [Magnetococcales bacterium]